MITTMMPVAAAGLQTQQSFDSTSSPNTQDMNSSSSLGYSWIKSSSSASEQAASKLRKQSSATSSGMYSDLTNQ